MAFVLCLAPAAHAQTSQAAPPTNHSDSATPATRSLSVNHYDVSGNTLLPQSVIDNIFASRIGTNITVETVLAGVSELQMEYKTRGYVTVGVVLPKQEIKDGLIHVEVFEGKVTEIVISNNRFFSSNNIIRAMPSLQTNMILNGFVFQAELDRANANRDRQIYPQIEPGPDTNTTLLRLEVKDRLPLHGHVELNNQNTPGTPETRLNTSLAYNNLWQLEHTLGLQYGFSPGEVKEGNNWNFYDQPLVANYSGFYRLPLTAAASEAQQINDQPANFGYDEGSRKFRLPASSGQAEMNFYASRSAIDTGTMSDPWVTLVPLTNAYQEALYQRYDHQDITVTENIGWRLTLPLAPEGPKHFVLSGGFDFKKYHSESFATNVFIVSGPILDMSGNVIGRTNSETPNPVAASFNTLSYLPFTLRWDGAWIDKHGSTSFGLGYTPNLWHSGALSNLQSLAGSTRASGSWNILNASLSRDQTFLGQWRAIVRADGQWVDEPLISNEQFGVGGLSGVRGYHEGEVFGDTGWRVTSELRTPPVFLGMVDATEPMHVSGVVFMDYGEVYRIDPPPGEQGRTPLWGTGFGMLIAISQIIDARFLVAWPLAKTPLIDRGQTRLYLGISAQF